MKRTITTEEFTATLPAVLDAVRETGDYYVISEPGKPETAVVPLHMLADLETPKSAPTPPATPLTEAEQQALIEELLQIGRDCAAKCTPVPEGTDHTAFLYDERGLPK